MMTVPIPTNASSRLGVELRRRRRRTLTLLGMFAVVIVLGAGLLAWRMADEYRAVAPAPPANEYVVDFTEDVSVEQQLAALRRHPNVEYVQKGKLPGIAVVRISGNVDAEVRALRDNPAVFQVQKSVAGMICH